MWIRRAVLPPAGRLNLEFPSSVHPSGISLSICKCIHWRSNNYFCLPWIYLVAEEMLYLQSNSQIQHTLVKYSEIFCRLNSSRAKTVVRLAKCYKQRLCKLLEFLVEYFIFWCLTLKLPGEGQMALPLEILAYGSHKKRKCIIEYEFKYSIQKFGCVLARRQKKNLLTFLYFKK